MYCIFSLFVILQTVQPALCLTCAVKTVTFYAGYEVVTNYGNKTCQTNTYCRSLVDESNYGGRPFRTEGFCF
jgi:hypothetical protein